MWIDLMDENKVYIKEEFIMEINVAGDWREVIDIHSTAISYRKVVKGSPDVFIIGSCSPDKAKLRFQDQFDGWVYFKLERGL